MPDASTTTLIDTVRRDAQRGVSLGATLVRLARLAESAHLYERVAPAVSVQDPDSAGDHGRSPQTVATPLSGVSVRKESPR